MARRPSRAVPRAALALALAVPLAVQAGVTFRLDRLRAEPGETVRIEAVFFNDSDNRAGWQPPRELVLQWRDPEARVVRTRATATEDVGLIELPVGRFATAYWTAVVPAQARGLQAINIEGEPVLLALEARPLQDSVVTTTPAIGPVIDPAQPAAGAVAVDPGVLSEVSGVAGGRPAAVAAAAVGPAPADAAPAPLKFDESAMTRFRTALSAHEPIYFSVGTRPHANARFQLSFKYRFFQPAETTDPVTGRRAQSAGFLSNLYFAYTQTSLWDLREESKPFRDSSYRPSLFWQSERLWASKGGRWSLGLEGGFEHESNGKDGATSRSLNSAYARPTLRYRFEESTLSVSPKFVRYAHLDENPDLRDFRGNVDYQVRWASDNGPMVSALVRDGRRKASVQLDFAYPLRSEWLSNLNGFLHLQYFSGYGETLLDYNRRASSQVRIGLMIVR